MNEPTHTPGPWFTFGNGVCVGGPKGPLGNPSGADTAGIAHCQMGLRTVEEARANARLIATLPQMREVLAAIVRAADGSRWSGNLIVDNSNPLIAAARDVLAQADGESQ